MTGSTVLNTPSTALTTPTVPQPAARKQIEELSRQKITTCYQCQKCSNGCPVSFAMDIVPHRVMRLLQLGLVDQVLTSETIWVCASCHTCTTRCPNDIDIAHVMDTLRKVAKPTGKLTSKNAHLFNSEFLSAVKQFGRLYELGMITRFTIRSQGLAGLLKQTSMGLNMVMKGKLKVIPHSLIPDKEVKDVFKQAERKELK